MGQICSSYFDELLPTENVYLFFNVSVILLLTEHALTLHEDHRYPHDSPHEAPMIEQHLPEGRN